MDNKLPRSPQGSWYPSKELNDALNFVLRFTCDNLPEGWEIRITARHDDASMELYDPEGDCVSTQWDTDSHTVRCLVNEAREACNLAPV